MGPPIHGDGWSSNLGDAVTVGDPRVPGFVLALFLMLLYHMQKYIYIYSSLMQQKPTYRLHLQVLL